jgi:hypothetical protein
MQSAARIGRWPSVCLDECLKIALTYRSQHDMFAVERGWFPGLRSMGLSSSKPALASQYRLQL